MTSAMRGRLRRVFRRAVGFRRPTRAQAWSLLRRAQGVARIERQLDALEARLVENHATSSAELRELQHRLADAEARSLVIHDLLSNDVREALRAMASDDVANRRRLWEARGDPEYNLPFTERRPLVSVAIPTHDRIELLTARSLPSILNQSHENLDVIVVGDDAPPEVEEAVLAIGDPRVTYRNLTQRLPLPGDPLRRWYVQSVMARNEGFRVARGLWDLSFDDDDYLHPDAIERLLAYARDLQVEVAYGRFRPVMRDGVRPEVGVFPPTYGEFGWQGALRHRCLRFFERELVAAAFNTPNDVFCFEAMLRAGVRFAMLPEVIWDYHPAREWLRPELR
jgi:Glycosyl transferase family 2